MSRRVINNKVLIINAGVLAGVTAVIGGILGGKNISAESANASVTVGSACTMTATVNTAHTTEIPAGTAKTDIGSTTLKTICNDVGGYAIYAVGYSNNEYGNNKMLNGTNEINTGTGSSASNWNISLSQVTTGTYATTIDGGFGSYSAIPATYTKVAHRDSMTDSTTGSSINLTYGAYVASTQAPGDYVGKVKFTMVHPATEVPPQPQPSTARCINYFPNGSNVIGTMGCQSATDNASVTLLASNFSRTGYGFAGWSDAYDYATNPSAHFYGPQETITAPEGTTANGLSLYAVWIKSQGSLQDTSKVASVCSSLTTAPTDGTANLSSVSALTDQRDGETYAIAKLADDNCWMIENLRLEAEDTRSDANKALAQGYGTSSTYGSFSGLADAESTGFTSTYTANGLYYSGTQEGTASIDIGTSNYPAYRMPRYNNINTSTRASSPTSNSVAMYSYGNYYTWHAAIADLTYNSTNNSSVTNTSLCPTGWHLPTGGAAYASDNTSGVNVTGDTSTFREFYNLGYKTMDEVKTAYEDTPNSGYAYYSSNTTNSANKTANQAFRSFPNNFLYSGRFNTSSAYGRGSYGYYWSSTAYGSYGSYYLRLYSSNVNPGTDGINKYYGYSIRCTVSAGT
ncbi:MAG: FISUMP domain-containing protein [Candidatus Saccharibacteria bacterium]|nr:FISUMP domain-containing protein [Candidatus Saccharibacteria bacterium]